MHRRWYVLSGVHRGIALLLGVLALLGAVGCATAGRTGPRRTRATRDAHALSPVVAVMDFENRAGFQGTWKLGDGMAELLTTRLVETGTVTVIERRQIEGVLAELRRQAQDLFRSEGRVERGRLKNARYLIRGAVTDFTVTRDTSGWFRATRVAARGRGSVARVAVHVSLSDVETGQIIDSVRAEGRASSRGGGVTLAYRDLQFGGDAFFRTPLGRATDQAIDRAVRLLLARIPPERWEPRVAEGGSDTAIVNGGMNVQLREGMEFLVRGVGRIITDPVTGDPIERWPGPVKGRLRIIEVREAASTAKIVEGQAGRGDHLEPVRP